MTITAIPMTYRGTVFRSTLEADWAAMFDELGWGWSYEPVAIRVDGGPGYLCDFHLPALDVWCEVKGPHDQRIDKTHAFAKALAKDDLDVRQPLVVILRPAGPGNAATWEPALPGSNIIIAHCPSCDGYTFMDTEGNWLCRRCYYGRGLTHDNKFWRRDYYTSGQLQFQKAPRPVRVR